MLFAPLERRRVAADFDGGTMTSDAGALLLGASDRAIGVVDRFAACFIDARAPELIEHRVATLVGQRVFGIALGYEDLSDHDHLRHDPVMAVLAGKLAARRSDCAPLAGKSTLNRLELSRPEPTRYHKIAHDPAAIERLFVDLFMEAHKRAPQQIILDLDATDDPLHGHQEGRFFHGYYDCYCYLPLYIFCGRHLLAARLRRSNIDGAAGSVEEVARIVAQLRARWPRVRVLLRADSGFAREVLMAWCEANQVDYLFGLARNARLEAEIAAELAEAAEESQATGRPARRFKDFMWTTLDSWSRRRRVIGKAECTQGRTQPALRRHQPQAQSGRGALPLREGLLRARRDGEPHQGMPARSLRRPHVRRDHARQPTAPVVRLDGLCAHLRVAPHRPRPYPVRRRHLRHHPSGAPQDRRPGADQRPAHPPRHGIRLPVAERVPIGPPTARRPPADEPETAIHITPHRRAACDRSTAPQPA